MNTTLHNHAAVGTAEKPLIPNAEFKAVVEAMNQGNMLAYDECLAQWSLDPYQKQFLHHKYNEQSAK